MALTVTVNASFYESWLRAAGSEVASAMSRLIVDVGKVNPAAAAKFLEAREVFVKTVSQCLREAPTPEQLQRLGDVLADLHGLRPDPIGGCESVAQPLTERGQVKLLVQRLKHEAERVEVLDAS